MPSVHQKQCFLSHANLDNLVKTGQLKVESMDQLEFSGLLRSGEARLHDAANQSLAAESSFDLAYNAAHSLSLAALRWHGYRSGNRYLVFQVLPHTLGVGPAIHARSDSPCLTRTPETAPRGVILTQEAEPTAQSCLRGNSTRSGQKLPGTAGVGVDCESHIVVMSAITRRTGQAIRCRIITAKNNSGLKSFQNMLRRAPRDLDY